MTDIAKIALLAVTQIIGVDLVSGPDRIPYWSQPRPPKTPDPKKRAKTKAARKQRNRK
jgi:hypothetical protein